MRQVVQRAFRDELAGNLENIAVEWVEDFCITSLEVYGVEPEDWEIEEMIERLEHARIVMPSLLTIRRQSKGAK